LTGIFKKERTQRMSVSFRILRLAFIGNAFLALAGTAGAEDMGLGSPADQKNLIAGICTTQLADLGASGCACLAERSLTELDDPQRAYLILSVVQPPAADRLPIANQKEDLAEIFNFLGAAHTACATPGAAPATDGGAAQPQ
jgi:hypothetical protein